MELPRGVFKYLDCSTGHITKEADFFLGEETRVSNHDAELIVYGVDYGYWLYVPPDQPEDLYVPGRIPECIIKLIQKAHLLECQWIKLDGDGTEHNDLPKYEWV